eukprot:479247_1
MSMLMEDWSHCKKNHIKTPKDTQYLQNIEAINCKHNVSCIYVRQHQKHKDQSAIRDDHADVKNMILMHLLNSVHTFIFHWMPSLRTITARSSSSHDNGDEDDKDTDNE